MERPKMTSPEGRAESAGSASPSLVFVIDDNPAIRKSVTRLLATAGLVSESFASADEFLARPPHPGPACLILDLQMPGMSGLELQERLRSDRRPVPIVFMTGHGDVTASVRAMKHGASDFLSKPVQGGDLLAAVGAALRADRAQLAGRSDFDALRARLVTLTPREREVFALIVTGLLNKQIASRLGTSERTIKTHRSRVMAKMGAGSLAELVVINEKLQRHRTDPS